MLDSTWSCTLRHLVSSMTMGSRINSR